MQSDAFCFILDVANVNGCNAVFSFICLVGDVTIAAQSESRFKTIMDRNVQSFADRFLF